MNFSLSLSVYKGHKFLALSIRVFGASGRLVFPMAPLPAPEISVFVMAAVLY